MGLPIGLAPEDGLPVGLQLMAPARADARLYTIGAALEQLLEQKWGHTLLSQAPDLSATEMFASEEGAV
jgi:aspartyl-tRNA(Asn)/glutamyl-tRNA(Gln) amidotransferase subunit A